MRTLFMAVMTLVISQVAFAKTGNLYCSGTKKDGQQVQIVVSTSDNTIEMNKEVRHGGMPPYPFVNEEQWKLSEYSLVGSKLSANGFTTKMTPGIQGSIEIKAKKAPKSDIYNGKAKITPITTRVMPAVAETLNVSCRFN